MSKLFKLNWVSAATTALLLVGSFLAPNAHAKKLYKSVNADGKVTYSNHPPANSQAAQNITLLKGSPKFSISSNQPYRVPGKS